MKGGNKQQAFTVEGVHYGSVRRLSVGGCDALGTW